MAGPVATKGEFPTGMQDFATQHKALEYGCQTSVAQGAALGPSRARVNARLGEERVRLQCRHAGRQTAPARKAFGRRATVSERPAEDRPMPLMRRIRDFCWLEQTTAPPD